MMGLSLRLTMGAGSGVQIITATSGPTLAAGDDTDTPADLFTTGSYESSEGTISDVSTVYLVNGSPEASTYDLDAGDTLQVQQTVTDSEANVRIFVTGEITIQPSVELSNAVAPAISGTAEVGETLTCSQGTWNGSASISYAYQWTRDGSPIAGADESTYTLVSADGGTDVGCTVTANDGFTQLSEPATPVSVPAPDTTAPVLTSPTDAANGSTGSTGSVTTDEGNGTLYWAVTSSATSPSAAQVKAGNDHTGSAADDSGSQSVSGTGAQALSPAPSGLTASTTYYTHFMHEDSSGNQSSVASADGFTTEAEFSPAAFFASAENGFWVQPGVSDVFQDTAGTTPAGVDDPVARIEDLSGNGNNGLQGTNTAWRPLLKDSPDRLLFDGANDKIRVDVGAAITGHILVSNDLGVRWIEINDTDGILEFPRVASYTPAWNNLECIVITEHDITLADVEAFADYLGKSVAVTLPTSIIRLDSTNTVRVDTTGWDTSAVVTFSDFANGASQLTEIDVSGWDTSSGEGFARMFLGASALTELDLSNWDTSSATSFSFFAANSSSLANVTINGGTGSPFSDSPCTDYNQAFNNTNLSQQSIDDILVAIEAAGTSNGDFDQSGGSAPSATGEAAITALRGRGWTVTVTGGF